MKLSAKQLPAEIGTVGLWVRDIPGMPPEFAVRVRPASSPGYQRIVSKMVLLTPTESRVEGMIDPQREAEIQAAAFAEFAITGLAGLEDDDGEPLECTPDLVRQIMLDPTLVEWRRGLVWAVGNVEKNGRANLKADEKN